MSISDLKLRENIFLPLPGNMWKGNLQTEALETSEVLRNVFIENEKKKHRNTLFSKLMVNQTNQFSFYKTFTSNSAQR